MSHLYLPGGGGGDYIINPGGTIDYTDFDDTDIFCPIDARDVTVTRAAGALTIASTVPLGGRNTDVNGTMAGVLFRYRIMPELLAGVPTIEVEVSVSAALNMGVTTGASNALDSLGGGILLTMAERGNSYAVGRNGFVNPNPRLFEHYANVDDLGNNAFSALQDAVDYVAANSWNIRERITDEGGSVGYRANDHFLSVDGGAYNVWKTTQRLYRLPALNARPGIGLAVGAFWNAMLENFSVTITLLRITRGIVIR